MCTSLVRKQNHNLLPRLVCVCYDFVSFKVSWIWLLIWLMLRNTARAARQQTAYSMVTSLCSRHLKGKGKGFLGTREMRPVHEEGVSDFNIHLVDVYNAKNIVSWQAFSSLPPSLMFLLHQKPTFPSIWNACHTGQVMSVNLFIVSTV